MYSTAERQFVLDDLPDTVNLYRGEKIGVDGYINVSLHADDYSAIDEVDLDFVCKDPENDMLSNVIKNISSSDYKDVWHMNVNYTPARIGKCVYTVTASIPGTDYKASKDITFIVHDGSSSVPSVEINRNYFNERNEYIGELVTARRWKFAGDCASGKRRFQFIYGRSGS